MDLLSKGSRWLERTRTRCASHRVAYRRGSQSVTLCATKGQTEFQILDERGTLVTFEAWDFLVQACELALDGVPTEPAADDQIVVTPPGQIGLVYVVMAPVSGTPPWKWHDRERQTYRIHTKYVGPLAT